MRWQINQIATSAFNKFSSKHARTGNLNNVFSIDDDNGQKSYECEAAFVEFHVWVKKAHSRYYIRCSLKQIVFHYIYNNLRGALSMPT